MVRSAGPLAMLLASPSGCGAYPVYTAVSDTAATSTTTTSAAVDDTSTSTTGTSTSDPADSSSTSRSTDADGPDTAGTTTATTGDPPTCGDGKLDPGEECDNGLAANDDSAVCLQFCTLARCGDGSIFIGKEECDDANSDPLDGCHLCGRTRKVFVTSQVYQADVFMGIGGADQRCRSLAAQAGLPNFAGYKAWLSDSTVSARDRMFHGQGRYELVNGLLVGENWAAIVAGQLLLPIDVTETSQTTEHATVWTGTNPNGTTAEGSDHCADWTSQEFEQRGFWGVATEISADWSLADSPVNPGDCGGGRGLYCFEQN